MVSKKEYRQITSNIGGICISFISDEGRHKDGIKDACCDNTAMLKLRVHYGHLPETNKKEKVFDSGTTWSLHKSRGKYILRDDSLESGILPETIIIMEPDLKSGDIYIKNSTPNHDLSPYMLAYPLNQVLMIMLLSLGKGIFLHACGIDDGSCGYLFPGNSTHGKSTIAKLWSESGATVLNDDRIIVREKDGELWMYGTPWHGDFKEVSPNGLPLSKIFFLKKSENNSAVPIKDAKAVSMLLTRSFPPLWDQKGMEYTLGLIDRMVNKIPCYELNFLPDKRIINFVRNI